MTRKQFYLLIIPTPNQLILYPLVSLVLLTVIYWQNLVRKFTPGGTVDLAALKDQHYQLQLGKYLDNSFTHTLVIVLFWGLVGLIAYTIVWVATNALITARNDVILETAYTNKGSSRKRTETRVERVALACLFLAIVLLSAVVLLPIWLGAFTTFVTGSLGLVNIAWAVIGILGMALNLYLVITLGQAFLNLV